MEKSYLYTRYCSSSASFICFLSVRIWVARSSYNDLCKECNKKFFTNPEKVHWGAILKPHTRATTAASFSIATSFRAFLKDGTVVCSCGLKWHFWELHPTQLNIDMLFYWHTRLKSLTHPIRVRNPICLVHHLKHLCIKVAFFLMY